MKIIMLAGESESSNYVYNALNPKFKISKVFIANTISKASILRRRIKKIGLFKVIDQIAFQIIIQKIVGFILTNKIKQRKLELGLIPDEIPNEKIIYLKKLNSDKTIKHLKKINADLIIVNGTSIISSKVLESTKAIFINTHVGITPQYRGVYGGYWALKNNDKNNFGATVHIVDKGVDTGSIVYQQTMNPSSKDNFFTYPLCQYSIAIPLLEKTIIDIKYDKLKIFTKTGVESKLYYHPGISDYLFGLIYNSVK